MESVATRPGNTAGVPIGACSIARGLLFAFGRDSRVYIHDLHSPGTPQVFNTWEPRQVTSICALDTHGASAGDSALRIFRQTHLTAGTGPDDADGAPEGTASGVVLLMGTSTGDMLIADIRMEPIAGEQVLTGTMPQPPYHGRFTVSMDPVAATVMAVHPSSPVHHIVPCHPPPNYSNSSSNSKSNSNPDNDHLVDLYERMHGATVLTVVNTGVAEYGRAMGKVAMWDIAQASSWIAVPILTFPHSAHVLSAASIPDHVVTSCAGGRLTVWGTGDKAARMLRAKEMEGDRRGLAITPGRRRLIVTAMRNADFYGHEGAIYVLDFQTLLLVYKLAASPSPRAGGCINMALTSGGRGLVVSQRMQIRAFVLPDRNHDDDDDNDDASHPVPSSLADAPVYEPVLEQAIGSTDGVVALSADDSVVAAPSTRLGDLLIWRPSKRCSQAQLLAAALGTTSRASVLHHVLFVDVLLAHVLPKTVVHTLEDTLVACQRMQDAAYYTWSEEHTVLQPSRPVVIDTPHVT